MKFNKGQPYHGSPSVQNGNLKGETDTDYFYFICPKCSGKRVLQIPEYTFHEKTLDNPYNYTSSINLKEGFVIAFMLYCSKCKFSDFVKIGNLGLQGGELPCHTAVSK